MAKPAVLIFTAELVEQNMLKSFRVIDVGLQSGLMSSDHKSSHKSSNFSIGFSLLFIIFLNVNLFNMS